MTLYLKYRPQTVAELDLSGVRQALAGYLEAKNMPHAWLFSGPRGTGKTSAARIIAKFINCIVKSGDKPCNKCEMCEAITNGSAVDIAEIDAASNRGIDEIRELRDKIRLAPMKARYKVYIIDEVHMLTTEAANALLKTLEEPPEKTIFILCTTDAEKLPETVISRCTRILFSKPTPAEIEQKLARVAKGEGLKLTQADLQVVARESRGSFRDGIKLLEQIIMSGGNVEAVAGVTGIATAEDLIDLVQTSQTKKALELVTKMDSQGVNWRRVVEAMVEILRQRLLEKAGKSEVATEIDMIRQLEQVYEQIKTAVVPQLPLEIWVIQNTGTGSNPKSQTTSHKEDNTLSGPPLNLRGGSKGGDIQGVRVDDVTKKDASGRGKYKLEDLSGKWAEVMKAVRPMNHSVEALLRSTRPIGFDGERLELEVFYKFHKDKLETEKCRKIVEDAVGQVIGETGIKLYLKLGQKARKEAEEVTAEGVDEGMITAAEEIFGAQAI